MVRGNDVTEGSARAFRARTACGVVAGPAFVSAFTAIGARRAGYDWRRHAVSSLADGREGRTQRANFMIAGTPTVQHAEGERALSPGDLACLPEGPAGGRRMLNHSGETARVLLLWTTGFPAAVCYPETGEWVLRTDRSADEIRLRADNPR